MKPRSIATGTAQAIALAFVVASAAIAQQGAPAVANLESVEGNVLVSTATGLAAGASGSALTTGTRVITPANGKAVIKFSNGCSVQLQPNQRFVIDPSKPCDQLLLLVQSTLPAPPVAPSPPPSGFLASAAPSGGLPDSVGYLMGGVAGVTAIVRWRQDENVSPN